MRVHRTVAAGVVGGLMAVWAGSAMAQDLQGAGTQSPWGVYVEGGTTLEGQSKSEVYTAGLTYQFGPRRDMWGGVVTTYGSPWWVVRLFAGDAGRKVLMRGMKPMCAKGVRSFYMAHYDMDHSSKASRHAFLDKVRRRMSRL